MKFSIRKSFKDSWNLFFSKKMYGKYILTSLLVVVGIYLMSGLVMVSIIPAVTMGSTWFALPVAVGLIVLYFMVYVILVSVNLPIRAYRKGKVDLKKTFSEMWSSKLIFKAIGMLLLVAIAIGGVGFALLMLVSNINPILGGIIFGVWTAFVAIRWAFGFYILIEEKIGAIDALKKSHKLMKNNNGWKFLWFVILISVISILVQIVSSGFGLLSGMLAQALVIIFGIFVAPWFSLLSASPYIQITKK